MSYSFKALRTPKEVRKRHSTRSKVPEFTDEPIPLMYLSPELENYMVQIPSLAYEDPDFAMKRLRDHFSDVLATVNGCIQEVIAYITVTQTRLTEQYTKSMHLQKKTLTRFNKDFWRQRIVIHLKNVKYSKRIDLEKLTKANHNLAILQRLKNLLEELVVRPRLVCLQPLRIKRLASEIKHSVLPKLQLRRTALELTMMDIRIAMSYLPKHLSSTEHAEKFIGSVITYASQTIDPVTSYVKDTEQYYIFCDFLEGPYGGIDVKSDVDKSNIDKKIAKMVDIMQNRFKFKNAAEKNVLKVYCIRYWFDYIDILGQEFQRARKQLSDYMERCKLSTLENQKPPKVLLKSIDLESTVETFIDSYELLCQARELLFSCIFLNNPIDLAYHVKQIHLILAGYCGSLLNRSTSDKAVLQALPFVWKCVIISACPPCIDVVFSFLERWSKKSLSDKVLYENVNEPVKVINELLKSCS